jgi:DNA-directed RNA polymerase subunit RPC12/RpoP
MDDDFIKCPDCGATVRVVILPDEKPDGTILGYGEAKCQQCGSEFSDAEIYSGVIEFVDPS